MFYSFNVGMHIQSQGRNKPLSLVEGIFKHLKQEVITAILMVLDGWVVLCGMHQVCLRRNGWHLNILSSTVGAFGSITK